MELVTTSNQLHSTNGGSAVAAITLASGATVTAPTQPTKTGFTFGGWYSDSALTTAYTFSVMPAENITLYAKWNAVVVQTTITFEVNGGSVVAAITQNAGTVVVAPTAPTKTGYTFAGWYSDIALTVAYTFNLMPSQNISLYAKSSSQKKRPLKRRFFFISNFIQNFIGTSINTKELCLFVFKLISSV